MPPSFPRYLHQQQRFRVSVWGVFHALEKTKLEPSTLFSARVCRIKKFSLPSFFFFLCSFSAVLKTTLCYTVLTLIWLLLTFFPLERTKIKTENTKRTIRCSVDSRGSGCRRRSTRSMQLCDTCVCGCGVTLALLWLSIVVLSVNIVRLFEFCFFLLLVSVCVLWSFVRSFVLFVCFVSFSSDFGTLRRVCLWWGSFHFFA